MSESALIWLAFAVIISILCIIALFSMSGCTTAQLAEYQSHVDSRSIEGYTKGTGVGAKYTVHYR